VPFETIIQQSYCWCCDCCPGSVHSTSSGARSSSALTTLHTGTSLQSTGRSIQEIFEESILPRPAGSASAVPASCLTYDSFRRAADLVQTRAFHMTSNNWLTGATQVGNPRAIAAQKGMTIGEWPVFCCRLLIMLVMTSCKPQAQS